MSAALIMPATLGLVRASFPNDRERARALALWSAAAGLALAVGPLLNGWVVETWGWPAVFYLNIPITTALMIGAVPLLPSVRGGGAGRLDLAGTLLSCLTLGGLVYGIIEGPNRGWTSVPVVLAWTVAVIALACFIVVERRVANPILDLQWFTNRHFAAGTGFALIFFTAMIGMLFLAVVFLLQFSALGALDTGTRLLPAGVGILAGAPVGERLYRRLGLRIPVVVGLVLAAGAALTLLSVDVSSGTVPVMLAGLLFGFGGGTAIPALTDSVMSHTPAERGGVTGGALDAAIEVAAALGIAIFGSVLNTVYANNLPNDVLVGLPDAQRETVQDSLAAAGAVAGRLPEPVAQPLIAAARDAFVQGFTTAALGVLIFAVAGAILAAVLAPMRATAAVGQP